MFPPSIAVKRVTQETVLCNSKQRYSDPVSSLEGRTLEMLTCCHSPVNAFFSFCSRATPQYDKTGTLKYSFENDLHLSDKCWVAADGTGESRIAVGNQKPCWHPAQFQQPSLNLWFSQSFLSKPEVSQAVLHRISKTLYSHVQVRLCY